MKIWSSFYVFNHPWDTVTNAAFRKYPNPVNPAVLGSDVIDRKVVNGVLHSHKLLTTQWGIPGWARKVMGHARFCYASERSEVNPSNKQMVVKTTNLTFYHFISVGETVKYMPHPEDENKTLLTQTAVIVVNTIPFSNYIEDLLVKAISTNAMKGRKGIEWIIESSIPTESQEKLGSESETRLLDETSRQLGDFTTKTKNTIDDLSNVAKQSFKDLNEFTVPLTSQSTPKL